MFDRENDQFLCKYQGRYFVSTISVVQEFGPFVDCAFARQALLLHELEAIYLIKEESDKWPENLMALNG